MPMSMVPKTMSSAASPQLKHWGCLRHKASSGRVHAPVTQCNAASLRRTHHHVQPAVATSPRAFHYFDPNTLEVVEVAASTASVNSRTGFSAPAAQDPSLSSQLDAMKGRLDKLQHLEGLYHESRNRTEQLQGELKTLNARLAERDEKIAQLSSGGSSAAQGVAVHGFGLGDGMDVAGLQEALARELRSKEGSVFDAIVSNSGRSSGGGVRAGPGQERRPLSAGSAAAAGGQRSPREVLSGLQALAQQIAEGMEREGSQLGVFGDAKVLSGGKQR